MSVNKHKAGKLGESFWANFYLIDSNSVRHKEADLREEVKRSNIQTSEADGGSVITMETLRANMMDLKKILRAKGFRVPRPSDKQVVNVWDLTKRTCNSTFLQASLINCGVCPPHIKEEYVANVSQSKTASYRMGKRKLDDNHRAQSRRARRRCDT